MKEQDMLKDQDMRTTHNTTYRFITATLFLVGVLFALPTQAGAELIGSDSAIDANLLYYQPVPAHPGDELDVWIQVTNSGGKASKPGTVTILDSQTFTPSSASDRTKSFPAIPAQELFLVKTKVRVAKDANEGTNLLRVRVQEEGSESFINRNLEIAVTGRSSAISIKKVTMTPEEILPGETATLAVEVENIGETKVRNIQMDLDLTDLSLAPSGSGTSQTIDELTGGQSHTYLFALTSYPDATAQAYRLPVRISYDDEQGNQKSQEEEIGIVIGAKPELLVYFDRIDLTKENPQGTVVIRFVNKGLSEIKLLEMRVEEAEGMEVTSESTIIYVGNIDTDDYESAELAIKTGAEGAVVPITVVYKDALNREYTETYDLSLVPRSQDGKQGADAWLWIIFIVVIVGGAWLWRRSRRRGKRK